MLGIYRDEEEEKLYLEHGDDIKEKELNFK
jgi:hypothetical protein